MINTLPSPKNKQKAPQKGRGMSTRSGGHYAGRGGKGATARNGYHTVKPGFEGGQNPLSRRLPKLKGSAKKSHGFTTSNAMRYNNENLVIQLSQLADSVKELKLGLVNPTSLVENKLVKVRTHKNPIFKIVFDKDISIKMNVEGIAMSAKAKAAIEKAGGEVK